MKSPLKVEQNGLLPQPPIIRQHVFEYTGDITTWIVPEGVTLTIIAAGAGGGNSLGWNPGGKPGKGARVQGTLPVKPGEPFQIIVGGAGGVGKISDKGKGGGGGGGSFVAI